MIARGDSRKGPVAVLLLLKLMLVGASAAIVLTVGILQWQDWESRRQERATFRQLEAHASTTMRQMETNTSGVADPMESRAIGIGNLPSPESFYPIQFVPRPPIVTGFERLTVAEAEGKIGGGELVLGVKIGDETRAYPLNMLNGPSREVINDELGGRAIAATW